MWNLHFGNRPVQTKHDEIVRSFAYNSMRRRRDFWSFPGSEMKFDEKVSQSRALNIIKSNITTVITTLSWCSSAVKVSHTLWLVERRG